METGISVMEPRLGVIAYLAKKLGPDALGRTSLMKLLYLAQELKNVPLDYHFTLYSYGPFDSDVLADLGRAESLEAVKSNVEYFSGGYRYKISPGVQAAELVGDSEFIQVHQPALDWVIENFGQYSPSDLELLSTIVFADQQGKEPVSRDDLAQTVNSIKPKFAPAYVRDKVGHLASQGLLTNLLQ